MNYSPLKRLSSFQASILLWALGIICCMILVIKSIYEPVRVWENVFMAYVKINETTIYVVYDCTITEYYNGMSKVDHDCGTLMAKTNNIEIYF